MTNEESFDDGDLGERPVRATRWAIVSEWEGNREVADDLPRLTQALYPTYEAALTALADDWRMVNINRIVRITMTIEHVANGWDTGVPGDDDGGPLPAKAPIDPALTRPADAPPPPTENLALDEIASRLGDLRQEITSCLTRIDNRLAESVLLNESDLSRARSDTDELRELGRMIARLTNESPESA